MSPAEPPTERVRISVVIPAFNAEAFLPATLRSVLAQQGADIEVIVVDDGSSDGTSALVAKDFPTVRLVRQHNAGVSAARNRGVREALHEWVAFVDADDIWLPGKLAAQVALLNEHPGCRLCYTAWQVWASDALEPEAGLLRQLYADAQDAARWSGPSGDIYPELLEDCHVWTSTVMIDRELFLSMGGFDPDRRIGEDYELWLKASRQTPILRVSRPLALYRHHGSNVTQRAPRANHKAEVVQQAIRTWGWLSPEGRSADRRAVGQGLARSWADFAGASLVLEGDTSQAWRSAWRSIGLWPLQTLAWKLLLKIALRQMGLPVARGAK